MTEQATTCWCCRDVEVEWRGDVCFACEADDHHAPCGWKYAIHGRRFNNALPQDVYFSWQQGPYVEFGAMTPGGTFVPWDVFNVWDYETDTATISSLYEFLEQLDSESVGRVAEWAAREA